MKKLLIALLLALAPSAAFALPVSHLETRFQLDRTALGQRVQLGTQLVRNKVQVMRATYSFATQGGSSAADIALLDSDGKAAILPSGAIIKQVLISTVTAPTSTGSATIALKAQSAGDLKAATAIASYTGLIAGVPVGTAATMFKLTAARTIYATVAVADLTAGVINVFIEYYLTD